MRTVRVQKIPRLAETEDDMDNTDRRCQTCRWFSGKQCDWPAPIWLDRILEAACEEAGLFPRYRTYGVPGINCPTWEPKAED